MSNAKKQDMALERILIGFFASLVLLILYILYRSTRVYTEMWVGAVQLAIILFTLVISWYMIGWIIKDGVPNAHRRIKNE